MWPMFPLNLFRRRPTFSRSITSARKIVANDNRSKAAAREAVDAFNATTDQLIAEQVAKTNDDKDTWKPVGPIAQNIVRRLGSKLSEKQREVANG